MADPMEDITAIEIERPKSDLDALQRLQEENAALRAELQALRAITQLPSPQPRSGMEQIFNILKLPRELRDAIYELCVVVGEVRIIRRGSLEEFDMRYHRPRDAKAEVQLFRVSQKVRCEALELYLSKNHFVIPAANSTSICSVSPIKYIPASANGTFAYDHLRSVSISLDGHDGFSADIRNPGMRQSAGSHYAVAERDTNSSMQFYHFDQMEEQNLFFREILTSVFDSHKQLHKLQFNLENASCGLGCHRSLDLIFDDEVKESIKSWASRIDVHRFESLDFLGTFDDEERQAILAAFPRSLHAYITFHGIFAARQQKWHADFQISWTDEEQEAHASDSTV